jgi:hypothetical protein
VARDRGVPAGVGGERAAAKAAAVVGTDRVAADPDRVERESRVVAAVAAAITAARQAVCWK